MNLRELRKSKSMTQQELSAKSELSQCYICALEQGRKKCPSLKTIKKLAAGLDVNAASVVAALEEAQAI